MTVSDHSKTIVDMITCVYDRLMCKLVPIITEESILYVFSANIALKCTNKVFRLMFSGSTVTKGLFLN